MSSDFFLTNNKRPPGFWLVLFLILLLKTPVCFAQELKNDRLDALLLSPKGDTRGWSSNLNDYGVTGSLRSSYWSSNRLSDSDSHFFASSVWLKLDKRLRRGLTMYLETYAYDEDTFGKGNVDSYMKEAYLHFRSGDWDYRLGRQIVAWGRADRLNPTDNLTPRDFTRLFPEVDEDRFGTEAIKISKIFGSYSSFTAIWIEHFEPNKLARVKLPGIRFIKNVPENNNQYALKFDQSGGEFDWSISYFNGVDLNSDFSVSGSHGGDLLVTETYNDVEIFGADIATIGGSNRYAAEISFTKTKDSKGNNPNVKNNSLYSVFAVERDFGDDLSLTTQLFYRQVSNYQDPRQIAEESIRTVASLSALTNNQLDPDEYGLNFRLGKNWLNETLKLEVSGATLLSRHGFLIRPELTYAMSDQLKVISGVEYFRGGPDTIFGIQEANKLFFFEGRHYF
ncbi:hypothetical protein N8Z26_02505 [Burkholderiales bacterium]|nr:hypothetical protein [Burkholderiales bacterium]